MKVFKVILFVGLTLLVFLFSPLLGFLAQSYLLDSTTQNFILGGLVQYGTQVLVSLLVAFPLYCLLWGVPEKFKLRSSLNRHRPL